MEWRYRELLVLAYEFVPTGRREHERREVTYATPFREFIAADNLAQVYGAERWLCNLQKGNAGVRIR